MSVSRQQFADINSHLNSIPLLLLPSFAHLPNAQAIGMGERMRRIIRNHPETHTQRRRNLLFFWIKSDFHVCKSRSETFPRVKIYSAMPKKGQKMEQKEFF